MSFPHDSDTRTALFEYTLRLGDDCLILGHRLSEWCGHGPTLEEDIALANMALDYIGQANAWLGLAGEIEGQGRDQDTLAYFRDTLAFRNVNMVELPRGDFGFTMVRQLFFSAYTYLVYEALAAHPSTPLAGIAAKAFKEARYHLRHSSEWIIRLGDGTAESHRRVQAAIDDLWVYTGELFEDDPVQEQLVAAGLLPDTTSRQARWMDMMRTVLEQATLAVPDDTSYFMTGGRHGRHTEHLGHLLAEMQILPRSMPDAVW